MGTKIFYRRHMCSHISRRLHDYIPIRVVSHLPGKKVVWWESLVDAIRKLIASILGIALVVHVSKYNIIWGNENEYLTYFIPSISR
ncbi:hypothetical protein AALP_AAs66555U000100, partial [Arabis alpina]